MYVVEAFFLGESTTLPVVIVLSTLKIWSSIHLNSIATYLDSKRPISSVERE